MSYTLIATVQWSAGAVDLPLVAQCVTPFVSMLIATHLRIEGQDARPSAVERRCARQRTNDCWRRRR
jgi:hypothetical protein